MKKLNNITALVLMKCPRCREGDMFQDKFLAKPHKFNKMHDECPVCKQDFHPEPGFYTGAMYFSYAINVGIIVTIFIVANLFTDPTLPALLAIVLTPTLLLAPINFRISRALMLHLFGSIGFEGDDARQSKKEGLTS